MKKFILPFFALFALASCGEEEDGGEDPQPQASEPTAFSPMPNQPIDGAFIALNTSSTVSVPFLGEQTIYIGTAVATSTDNTSMGTFLPKAKN